MRNNIEDVLDQPDPNDREILRQVFKNDKNKKKAFCFKLKMLENICSIILLFIRFFALSFTRATFHAIYRRFSAREFLKSLFGGWTFASFVLKYNSKYPRSILTAFHVFHFITLRQKQNLWLRVLRAIIYALFHGTSILRLYHGLFEGLV